MSIIILITFILSILFKIKGYNNLIIIINEIFKNIKKRKLKQNLRKKKNKINIIKTNDETIERSYKKLKHKVSFNNIKINSKQKFNKNYIKKNGKKKYENETVKKNNIIIKYNDYEMNKLPYKEALKIDKRSYFQYYFSLLRTKQLIIFTFFNNSDYNSKIIKIILFLFDFSLYFTVNALFFNDSNIHKIYEDFGEFNFIYQLSNILYSTIINEVITMIIKYFSLTESDILKIKNEKKNKSEKFSKLLNFINIKYIIFFILCFVFFFFFWFYLTCFCAVYKYSQFHLIKDTLISFGFSLLYPFIINLLPGLFRLPSLKSNNKEYLYKTSKYLQLIF